MKRNIDVLIVARPDHSMQIYKALVSQEELSFKFLSFKIFPEWVKKLIALKKMTTVTRNAICSWKLTFVDICRYKYKFLFAQSWDETHILDNVLRKIFSRTDVGLIHYWPEYGHSEILNYFKAYPQTKIFADVHMPHPLVVYRTMEPIYRQYGIDSSRTHLYEMSREQGDLLEGVTDVIVPSSYVAQTYNEIYKDKIFHVVSYGIAISPSYFKRKRTKIKEFVYAGRISLEKGSDLLLKFFAAHPYLNIHLFGSIISGQEHIFNAYQGHSNIIFHGAVPKVELHDYLKKYDVGIHLSRFDAYSLAVGEMIGVGLPVIVSSNTGNKEDVETFGFGEVVDLEENQIEKVIQKICNLDNYNHYAENIDKYICNSPSLYGDKMVSFYKKVLRNL